MSLVQLPGFGLFRGNAGSSNDVLVGAAAGVAGIAGIKFLVNKFAADKLPAIVIRALPLLSGAVTAGALYATGKRGGGKGRALGALLAGAAINIWDEVRANVPSLADLVSVNLGNYRGGYGGMLVENRGYQGVLVDNSARNLEGLHAINMAPDDD